MGIQRAHVLLVEDDQVIRKMYSDFLRNGGFEVSEEPSAVDAVDRISGGQEFDLVVTDIMMARMDGWEFLHTIRETLGFDSLKLPVIVMSAHFDSDRLRVDALRRGASATYMKTEPLSKLLKEIRIHAGLQRSKFDDDDTLD